MTVEYALKLRTIDREDEERGFDKRRCDIHSRLENASVILTSI